MKKRSFITLVAAASSAAAVGGVVALNGGSLSGFNADGATFGILLNSENRVTELHDGAGTNTVQTYLGNSIVFNYTKASTIEGKHVGLATGGTIENVDYVHGVESVKATFTGALDVYGSADGYDYVKVGTLTSGSENVFEKTWDKINLVATAETVVENIDIKHSCTSRFTGVETAVSIVGFDSVLNTGVREHDYDSTDCGRRGWGSNFWAGMNFGFGEGGRFHFFSPLGGNHTITFETKAGNGDVTAAVALNGVKQADLALPGTPDWYGGSAPAAQTSVVYNLAKGWNELEYTMDKDANYFQMGRMTMSPLEGRRFDPSEIDTSIKTLHFEGEQGYFNGGYGMQSSSNLSGGFARGGIDAIGNFVGLTFNLPSQGTGTYRLTAKVGCGTGVNIAVHVDDMKSEWLAGATTTDYSISTSTGSGGSQPWLTSTETTSVDIELNCADSGWNRIRLERPQGSEWFTVDCVDLVKIA